MEWWIEHDLVMGVTQDPGILNVGDVQQVIETVARSRNVPVETVRANILRNAGFQDTGTFSDDELRDRTLWVESPK